MNNETREFQEKQLKYHYEEVRRLKNLLAHDVEPEKMTASNRQQAQPDMGLAGQSALGYGHPCPSAIGLFNIQGSERISHEALEKLFEYDPWDETQVMHGKAVRKALAAAFATIIEEVPPSHFRTNALTKILEARMDANAAITFRGQI